MVRRSEADWQALFAEHESSGLTAAEFCRRRSVCQKHFSVRKRQLNWKPSAAFVQVKPIRHQTKTPASEVTIRIVDMRIAADKLEGLLTELLR